MGRPPVIPAEKKLRIVLSVLAGEVTIAEAARREKISEQSIGRWKAEFLEAGKQGLIADIARNHAAKQDIARNHAARQDIAWAIDDAPVPLQVCEVSAAATGSPSHPKRMARERTQYAGVRPVMARHSRM